MICSVESIVKDSQVFEVCAKLFAAIAGEESTPLCGLITRPKPLETGEPEAHTVTPVLRPASGQVGGELSAFVYFLAGVTLWPALEYALHSGLGHHFLRGKTAFSREHLRHHAEKDFFAPTWKKIAAAIPVFGVLLALLTLLSSLEKAAALTLGFALMYATYEVIHRRAHTHGPSGPYSRWVRRNHFSHHFQNPRKNHGVTTPFFDYLFGTHVDPGKVLVPERFAMRWLCDPATGDVWPHLADDYELRKATKPSLRKREDHSVDLRAAYDGEAPEL